MFGALDAWHVGFEEGPELHDVELSPAAARVVARDLTQAVGTVHGGTAVDADMNGDSQLGLIEFEKTDLTRRLNTQESGVVIGIAHAANLLTTHSIK